MTFLGECTVIKVLEEESANVKLEKTFCFSTTHFICASQNILWFDLPQVIFLKLSKYTSYAGQINVHLSLES